MAPLTPAARRRVLRAYVTPGHPVAFSAPARVAKHFGISGGKAKELLEEIEGYTLHREFKQPRHYNPYYVHGRREQAQADLVDVARLAADNGGVTFLLVLIDVMTKRMWVYPLKNKNAETMRAAMDGWLRSLRTKPKTLTTDRGNEFVNRRVQQALRQHDVEWQPANGTLKAAIAERVNKTLQILMYKYMTENETTKYVGQLPALVRTYNRRGHRTLEGMTPAEADKPRNENRLRAIFHARYEKIGRMRKLHLPFKVGDVVRVKSDPKKITSAARAYAQQFKGEFFRIVRINRTLPIALYYLRSNDNDDYIEGGFYANELQRQRGDVYKIEAELGRRVRRGVREILVKWKYFGPRWNQWIPEADVRRVF